DEACLGRRDDAADLGMPSLEGGERALDRGAVGPVFAVPGVVLGPTDEVEEPSARDEIVHEMRAGSEPGLVAALQPKLGDALARHQPAIGDAAGELRGLGPEQRLADG